jgi:riboflavin synthase
MFTGLIETTGTVLEIEQREGSRRIAISAPGIVLRMGDSIAVSGVCLTAVDLEPSLFHADLAAETVSRTSLSMLAPGTTVNLELPTAAGAPLGGHVVQGHVDATGTLLSLDPVGTDWWLRVAVPAQVSRYMVEKGSIAIEGISLTIARWEPGTPQGDVVSVAIIPHTYTHTNLHSLTIGQPVNIEADVLIKFMDQREREGRFDLTVDYLVANGY